MLLLSLPLWSMGQMQQHMKQKQDSVSVVRPTLTLNPQVYEVEVLIGLRCCSKAWLVRSAASCEHGVPGQALSVTHVVLLHL